MKYFTNIRVCSYIGRQCTTRLEQESGVQIKANERTARGLSNGVHAQAQLARDEVLQYTMETLRYGNIISNGSGWKSSWIFSAREKVESFTS